MPLSTAFTEISLVYTNPHNPNNPNNPKFGVIILLKMETHARLHGLRVFMSSLTGVATTYEYEAWS